jgi:hypothetical protein
VSSFFSCYPFDFSIPYLVSVPLFRMPVLRIMKPKKRLLSWGRTHQTQSLTPSNFADLNDRDITP